MSNYIDGFVFPIQKKHLQEYKAVAEEVADIWKEHGAIAYSEYLLDDPVLEGTRSFIESLNTNEDEVVVFGFVEFQSREARNTANLNVPKDPRMNELVRPLMDPKRLIFDARRMIYGGFKTLL